MSTLAVPVPASLDGVRVDRSVALLADLSRSTVERLVAAGKVSVDGVPVLARSRVLRTGELLEVDLEDPRRSQIPEADESVSFSVVHEDDDVVVVDQPAGLVGHPGAGHRSGTLVNGLLARYPELADLLDTTAVEPDRPGIVHRLDRGTSGLLVVARTPVAYDSLVAQLTARTVSRRYRALLVGTLASDEGVVDAPIGRSESAPTRMAVSRKGKPAVTRYRVVARSEEPVATTLVEATLETGRTHQIRVHLAAIGHPVAGDTVYGRGRVDGPSGLARPFLHARLLGFDHPVTGDRVEWTSPLPADLVAVLAELGYPSGG